MAPSRRRPRSVQHGWHATGVIAALVLIATVWWLVEHTPRHRATSAEAIPSIAVLPFDNMSGDASLEYLGDGIAEDVITTLSRFPDIAVIARNSSFTYKGKAEDIRTVGKELGVDYVLEGSVRKDPSEMRITAQLIEAANGRHVWADRFDESGPDPLVLQDSVARKIVATLTGEVGQLKQGQYQRAWGKDTANLGEYDYYLRGHDWLMKAASRADNERAGRIWEEGLVKYPNSNLLKIKLGFYHWQAAVSWWSDDPAAEYRKAGELVRTVLESETLTPQVRRLAHWLFALVLMQEGDFKRAVAEAKITVALSPYDAFVMAQLADVLIVSGEYATALDWLDKAEARDPSRPERYLRSRAYIHRLMGSCDEAIKEYLKSGDNAPYELLSMSICYVKLGQIDNARLKVREARKLDPTLSIAAWRVISFYSDPAILNDELAALARAGLPET